MMLAAMMKLGQRRTPYAYAPARSARQDSGWKAAGVLALMIACQCGCTVYQSARRTLIEEPSQFSWRLDRGRSLKVYRQWADEAWAAESVVCPEIADADDYSLGFRDGFVDFVYAGGAGEPPPLPPRKFWNIGWRTPAGANAAEQWFAGYRHGAQVARDGGYRMSGVVNSTNTWAEPAAWGGPTFQSEPQPEVVPTPNESSAESPESLDDQMLPPPPRSADPVPSEQDAAIEYLLDNTGIGEMPSPDAPPTADSPSHAGILPAGRMSPGMRRRAISSDQLSNATDAER
jgi:hypothetical protein